MSVWVDRLAAKESLISIILRNMKENVIAGVKNAQANGVKCEMPTHIEVDMALDCDGCPCTGVPAKEAARLKLTVYIP